LTPERYLELEAASELRHEYFRGEVFAMSGASLTHNQLKDRTVRLLGNQLEGKPCFTVSSDMRLKVEAVGHYTYPDVMVVCGEPQLLTELGLEHLLNPTVIIEVLSDSTEAYDRGLKFKHYQAIPSFQEYLLISQSERRVDHYQRVEDYWILRTFIGLAVIELPSIGCQLALADLYKNLIG
jgi:Uma2 family endonuclease